MYGIIAFNIVNMQLEITYNTLYLVIYQTKKNVSRKVANSNLMGNLKGE